MPKKRTVAGPKPLGSSTRKKVSKAQPSQRMQRKEIPEWKQRLYEKEKKRRERIPQIVSSLLKDLFPEQRKFANDPARVVVAHPGRRAGKTYGVCARLTIDCLANAGKGVTIPYVHKTLTSGSANMAWNTLLEIGNKYNLGLKVRTNPLRTLTYPGGCAVWFVGADKEDQIEKLRGDSYPAAYIDEAGTYRPKLLEKLVDDVLSPALVEREGPVVMVGTPSYVARGPFYDNIHDHRLEASVHHWTMLANPHIPNAKQEMERILKRKLWDKTHPTFRREYLGEWVFEKRGLVYSGFDPRRNLFDGVLDNANDERRWRYLLGIDYGFNPAPTAFCVMAYDTQLPRVRILRCYEEEKFTHNRVAVEVEKLSRQWPEFESIVVDAAHPELIETMKQRVGLNVIGSQKQNKMGYIETMNGEFSNGVVLVHQSSCSSLVEQYKTLPLSSRSNQSRLVEDSKNFANHSCHVPGTLVCANRGRFLPIETIRPGDTVLTAEGNWRKVVNVMSRRYSGDVVRVGAQGTESPVSTPEHEYVVDEYTRSYKGGLTGQARATGKVTRERADSLLAKSLRHVAPLDAPVGGTLQSFIDGYYLAEGHCNLQSGGVWFSGHQDEIRVAGVVEDWANAIRTRKRWASDSVFAEAGSGAGRSLRVYNMKHARRFNGFSKGTAKHHPDLFSCNLQALLEGYFHGDGHLSPQGIKASSVSRELAYQVVLAARTLGLKASVCKLNRAGRYRGFGPGGLVPNDSYQVTLTKLSTQRFLANSLWPELWEDKKSHPCEPVYNREQESKRAKVTSTTVHEYTGPVYTLEVAGDHTYTVNGLATHNCDSALYAWRECRHYYAEIQRVPTRQELIEAREQEWLDSLVNRNRNPTSWWQDDEANQPPPGLFMDVPWWAREE